MMGPMPYEEGKIEMFLSMIIFGGCVIAKGVNPDLSNLVPVIGFTAPIWFCMGWRMLILQYSLREAAEECKWHIIFTLGLGLFFILAMIAEKIMSLTGE